MWDEPDIEGTKCAYNVKHLSGSSAIVNLSVQKLAEKERKQHGRRKVTTNQERRNK